MSAVGSLEAEAAVLGCLLSLPLGPAKDVAWKLNVEDFTDPRQDMLFGHRTGPLRGRPGAPSGGGDPAGSLGEGGERGASGPDLYIELGF